MHNYYFRIRTFSGIDLLTVFSGQPLTSPNSCHWLTRSTAENISHFGDPEKSSPLLLQLLFNERGADVKFLKDPEESLSGDYDLSQLFFDPNDTKTAKDAQNDSNFRYIYPSDFEQADKEKRFLGVKELIYVDFSDVAFTKFDTKKAGSEKLIEAWGSLFERGFDLYLGDDPTPMTCTRIHYVPFDRSNSMSRHSTISFIMSERYDAVSSAIERPDKKEEMEIVRETSGQTKTVCHNKGFDRQMTQILHLGLTPDEGDEMADFKGGGISRAFPLPMAKKYAYDALMMSTGWPIEKAWGGLLDDALTDDYKSKIAPAFQFLKDDEKLKATGETLLTMAYALSRRVLVVKTLERKIDAEYFTKEAEKTPELSPEGSSSILDSRVLPSTYQKSRPPLAKKVAYDLVRGSGAQGVKVFDGEGLIGEPLAKNIDDEFALGEHHSYQIRLNGVKGVVHRVDFVGYAKDHHRADDAPGMTSLTVLTGKDLVYQTPDGPIPADGYETIQLTEEELGHVCLILDETMFKIKKPLVNWFWGLRGDEGNPNRPTIPDDDVFFKKGTFYSNAYLSPMVYYFFKILQYHEGLFVLTVDHPQKPKEETIHKDWETHLNYQILSSGFFTSDDVVTLSEKTFEKLLALRDNPYEALCSKEDETVTSSTGKGAAVKLNDEPLTTASDAKEGDVADFDGDDDSSTLEEEDENEENEPDDLNGKKEDQTTQDDDVALQTSTNEEASDESNLDVSNPGEVSRTLRDEASGSDDIKLLRMSPELLRGNYYQKKIAHQMGSCVKDIAHARFIVPGTTRFLSSDLLWFMANVFQKDGCQESQLFSLAEKPENETFWAPGLEGGKRYALNRNPHVAREETVCLNSLDPTSIKETYGLDKLTGVLMINPCTSQLVAESLGGADYDGDHVSAVAEETYVKGVDFTSGDTRIPLVVDGKPKGSDAAEKEKEKTSEGGKTECYGCESRRDFVQMAFSCEVGAFANSGYRATIKAYPSSSSFWEDPMQKETIEKIVSSVKGYWTQTWPNFSEKDLPVLQVFLPDKNKAYLLMSSCGTLPVGWEAQEDKLKETICKALGWEAPSVSSSEKTGTEKKTLRIFCQRKEKETNNEKELKAVRLASILTEVETDAPKTGIHPQRQEGLGAIHNGFDDFYLDFKNQRSMDLPSFFKKHSQALFCSDELRKDSFLAARNNQNLVEAEVLQEAKNYVAYSDTCFRFYTLSHALKFTSNVFEDDGIFNWDPAPSRGLQPAECAIPLASYAEQATKKHKTNHLSRRKPDLVKYWQDAYSLSRVDFSQFQSKNPTEETKNLYHKIGVLMNFYGRMKRAINAESVQDTSRRSNHGRGYLLTYCWLQLYYPDPDQFDLASRSFDNFYNWLCKSELGGHHLTDRQYRTCAGLFFPDDSPSWPVVPWFYCLNDDEKWAFFKKAFFMFPTEGDGLPKEDKIPQGIVFVSNISKDKDNAVKKNRKGDFLFTKFLFDFTGGGARHLSDLVASAYFQRATDVDKAADALGDYLLFCRQKLKDNGEQFLSFDFRKLWYPFAIELDARINRGEQTSELLEGNAQKLPKPIITPDFWETIKKSSLKDETGLCNVLKTIAPGCFYHSNEGRFTKKLNEDEFFFACWIRFGFLIPKEKFDKDNKKKPIEFKLKDALAIDDVIEEFKAKAGKIHKGKLYGINPKHSPSEKRYELVNYCRKRFNDILRSHSGCKSGSADKVALALEAAFCCGISDQSFLYTVLMDDLKKTILKPKKLTESKPKKEETEK